MFHIKVNVLQSVQIERLKIMEHTLSLKLVKYCQSNLKKLGKVLTWFNEQPCFLVFFLIYWESDSLLGFFLKATKGMIWKRWKKYYIFLQLFLLPQKKMLSHTSNSFSVQSVLNSFMSRTLSKK